MSTKQISPLCLIISLVLLAGCGPKMPDGMPKLYPVTITVTQENKPLADALVSLRSVDPAATGTWTVGGRTDTNGSVELYTDGFRGAPLGKFKVVLIKQETEGMEALSEAQESGGNIANAQKGVKIWSVVKEEYNSQSQTPLEVEITAGTKTLELDAGPAVKIEVPFVP